MFPLLRTLTFFVVFWLYLLLAAPILWLFRWRARRWSGPRLRTRIAAHSRTWGRMVCMLGGVRMTIEDRSGVPGEEAVLLVGNHQGDFDIPVLLAAAHRDLAFVAKRELARIPLISGWMRLMGCVFLDRRDRRKQVAQLRETIDRLREGLSMVVFPEGTRSRGPDMRPFAKGSLNLAEKAGVRIVPVTLRDTWKLFPKGAKLFPGGEVTVIFHPAIDPVHPPDPETPLHETVHRIVESGLDPES